MNKILKFNGETIVITDPCYLMRHNDNNDDWSICNYGSKMELLGFTHQYITSRNGFGDGVWKINNTKSGELLGEIWADSGQTGIYLLNDILKYNPEYKERSFVGAIVLENFTGEIDWTIKTEKVEPPDFIVEASKILGKPIPEEYLSREVPGALVIKCTGKCGDNEVDFVVDFDNVELDDL